MEARLTRLLGRETGDAVKDAITLRDLLTMSSCLECNDWDDASAGNEERMYPTDDWVGFALGLPVREARSFSYCTAGVVCLGVALEHALGEPLPDFAERELFLPLGIDRWHWPQTPRNESSAAGGLELTSRALHELGRSHLERRVVPSAWLVDAMTAQTRIDAETEYGYLWWLRSFGGHRLRVHDRHGRQSRSPVPRARCRRGDHDDELRPSRRARAQRPVARGAAPSARDLERC